MVMHLREVVINGAGTVGTKFWVWDETKCCGQITFTLDDGAILELHDSSQWSHFKADRRRIRPSIRHLKLQAAPIKDDVLI